MKKEIIYGVGAVVAGVAIGYCLKKGDAQKTETTPGQSASTSTDKKELNFSGPRPVYLGGTPAKSWWDRLWDRFVSNREWERQNRNGD